MERSGSGLIPHPSTATDVELHRGNSYLHLLSRELGRLVSQGDLERRVTRCRRGVGVVGVLYPGQVSTPA